MAECECVSECVEKLMKIAQQIRCAGSGLVCVCCKMCCLSLYACECVRTANDGRRTAHTVFRAATDGFFPFVPLWGGREGAARSTINGGQS